MAVGDYITVDQLRSALAIKSNLFDDELQLAVTAASRMIDEFCSDQFWNPTAPEARVFTPVQRWRLLLPSFATASGLSVTVDNDGDGTFETTWTVGTDFQATPTAPRPRPAIPPRNFRRCRPLPRLVLLVLECSRLPWEPLPLLPAVVSGSVMSDMAGMFDVWTM